MIEAGCGFSKALSFCESTVWDMQLDGAANAADMPAVLVSGRSFFKAHRSNNVAEDAGRLPQRVVAERCSATTISTWTMDVADRCACCLTSSSTEIRLCLYQVLLAMSTFDRRSRSVRSRYIHTYAGKPSHGLMREGRGPGQSWKAKAISFHLSPTSANNVYTLDGPHHDRMYWRLQL